jgi:hypothetical protein
MDSDLGCPSAPVSIQANRESRK